MSLGLVITLAVAALLLSLALSLWVSVRRRGRLARVFVQRFVGTRRAQSIMTSDVAVDMFEQRPEVFERAIAKMHNPQLSAALQQMQAMSPEDRALLIAGGLQQMERSGQLEHPEETLAALTQQASADPDGEQHQPDGQAHEHAAGLEQAGEVQGRGQRE